MLVVCIVSTILYIITTLKKVKKEKETTRLVNTVKNRRRKDHLIHEEKSKNLQQKVRGAQERSDALNRIILGRSPPSSCPYCQGNALCSICSGTGRFKEDNCPACDGTTRCLCVRYQTLDKDEIEEIRNFLKFQDIKK